LGDVSTTYWAVVYSGQLLKNISQIFGYFVAIDDKKWAWVTSWAIFSRTHPVTLHRCCYSCVDRLVNVMAKKLQIGVRFVRDATTPDGIFSYCSATELLITLRVRP
jgi:hypothetical protein